jgi:hypothetical protein
MRQTGMNPLLAPRAMAITQTAVYDAANSIDRSSAPYFAHVHASHGAPPFFRRPCLAGGRVPVVNGPIDGRAARLRRSV